MAVYTEKYEDVNVEGIDFYIKSEDNKIYKDEDYNTLATPEEIIHAFNMGDLILSDGECRCRAINCTVDGEIVYVSYLLTTRDGNTVTHTNKQAQSFKLVASTDIEADFDLFGKVVSDLQSDIVISENEITGTLNYVTGYTGFSGKTEEQEGNYLAIYVDTDIDEDIYVEVVNGFSGPIKLDSDKIIVLRIANNEQSVKITCGNIVKVYSLANLTLASE